MKKNKDKEEDPSKIADSMERWFLIAFVLFCLWGLFYGAKDFVSFTKGYFNKIENRDSKKTLCAEEISNVKNELAAKKLYQACMNR